MDVTILRVLDASLPAPPGGRVTYLAEVDGARAGSLPLSGWPGVLEPHPLRLPYAEPGGPSRDLAWADARLEDHGIAARALPSRCGRGTSPACGGSRSKEDRLVEVRATVLCP